MCTVGTSLLGRAMTAHRRRCDGLAEFQVHPLRPEVPSLAGLGITVAVWMCSGTVLGGPVCEHRVGRAPLQAVELLLPRVLAAEVERLAVALPGQMPVSTHSPTCGVA